MFENENEIEICGNTDSELMILTYLNQEKNGFNKETTGGKWGFNLSK